jgi:hypothetical protein
MTREHNALLVGINVSFGNNKIKDYIQPMYPVVAESYNCIIMV